MSPNSSLQSFGLERFSLGLETPSVGLGPEEASLDNKPASFGSILCVSFSALTLLVS